MTPWRLAAALVLAWASGCSPRAESSEGSESHFLGRCEEGCAEGLGCICGVCTALCDSAASCSDLDPRAQCLTLDEHGAGFACEDAATSSFCDLPCITTDDCQARDPAFFCNRGFCRVDPLHRAEEPLPGYGALCEQAAVSCQTAEAPPALAGSYLGQGTVVLSSNALWAVGDRQDLTVQINQQAGGLLDGSITLPSLDLSVTGAVIRGEGQSFTIYGVDVSDYDGCSLEARAVISGTVSGDPATVSGGLALRFTGNFQGTGCTPEQLSSYPGTGADFTHIETRNAQP